MDKNIKALNFNKELNELLKKYNCELKANHITEEVDYYIDNTKYSYCKNNKPKKEVFGEKYNDFEQSMVDLSSLIMRDRIKKIQDTHIISDEEKLKSLGNKEDGFITKFRTLILTNNEILADIVFNKTYSDSKEYISKYISGKSQKRIEFENGEIMTWLRPNGDIRGHKFTEAHIDENVDIDFFNEVAIPMLIFADGKKIKILQDSIEDML